MFMKVGKALDVRAQQLLKDLLDDATDKILNTHSEVSPHLCKNFAKALPTFDVKTIKISTNTFYSLMVFINRKRMYVYVLMLFKNFQVSSVTFGPFLFVVIPISLSEF